MTTSVPETPKTTKMYAEFSYRYVLADFLLRWSLLALLHYRWVLLWQFYLACFVGIPFVVLIWALFSLSGIEATYGPPSEVSVELKMTRMNQAVVGFFVVSGTFTFFVLIGHDLPSLSKYAASFGAFLLYALYMTVVSVFSEKRKPKSSSIHPKDVADLEVDELLTPADDNDTAIVQLEVQLVSLTERVNAYIIESVLFGALAFTSFVQIVTSDKLNIVEIHGFMDSLYFLGKDIVLFDMPSAANTYSALQNPKSLLSAILLESLFCAMFFLSVIASRLRCSDVIEKVSYYIHLARAYNDREAEIHNIKLQRSFEATSEVHTRLDSLEREIEQALRRANLLIKETNPIVAYMRTFRGLGIASFLCIVITGSFIVGNSLAGLFIILALLAFLYSGIERGVRNHKFKRILSRRS